MIIIPVLVFLVRGIIRRWRTRPTQYDRYLATNEMRSLVEGTRLLTRDEWETWRSDASYVPPPEAVRYPRPTRFTIRQRAVHAVTHLRLGYGLFYALIHFNQNGR